MFEIAAQLDAWSADWSVLVIAMLWQSTLVAVVVAVVARLMRRASPAIRYWLWQIVAIKMLVLPFWTVSAPVPWLPTGYSETRAAFVATDTDRPSAGAAEPAIPSVATDRMLADAPPPGAARGPTGGLAAVVPPRRLSWTAWIMLAWAVIVAGQIALVVWQRARLRRLLRLSAAAEPSYVELVADCAARLGLRRVTRVAMTEEDCSPFVCGIFRPVVVLPQSISSIVPGDQLAPVLIHELAHVKRLDLLWNWIPQLARMLYFFHPVAHWVAFRVRLEAELACDGWAMATSGRGARAYADLLIQVVSRLSEPAMLRTGSVASAGLDGRASLDQQDRTRPIS